MQILETLGSCLHGINSSQGLTTSLFLAGLVGGFTHCVAMCGPFVIVQTGAQTGQIEKLSEATLLPYHLGRITTYVLLAVLLATILNLVFLFVPVRGLVVAPVLMLAGLVFLGHAFPSFGRYFSWIHAIRLSFPLSFPARWISGLYTRLSTSPTAAGKFAMGLLLGLMPCGLVTSALMAAGTAETAASAALAMTAFGAGTVPALVGTAYAGQALGKKYPRAMGYVRQGLMVWSGLWLFIMAGVMLV